MRLEKIKGCGCVGELIIKTEYLKRVLSAKTAVAINRHATHLKGRRYERYSNPCIVSSKLRN